MSLSSLIRQWLGADYLPTAGAGVDIADHLELPTEPPAKPLEPEEETESARRNRLVAEALRDGPLWYYFRINLGDGLPEREAIATSTVDLAEALLAPGVNPLDADAFRRYILRSLEVSAAAIQSGLVFLSWERIHTPLLTARPYKLTPEIAVYINLPKDIQLHLPPLVEPTTLD